MKKPIRSLLLAASCVLLSSSFAMSRQVTLVLNDQNGNPIAGSKFSYASFGTVSNGATVDVADGTHYITILPGINGTCNYDYLRRVQPIVVDANCSGQLEWITKTVTISVLDQNGAPIEGSEVVANTYAYYRLANGSQGTFPITDAAIYPTVKGLWANSGHFEIRPGINGACNADFLRRQVSVRIDDAFSGEFEWITKTVTISVHDQQGTPIEGSEVVANNYTYYRLTNGSPGTFPITDATVYPTVKGLWANSGHFEIRPGINGACNAEFLKRQFSVKIDEAFTGDFEWKTVGGPLYVVDVTGSNDVIGSKIYNQHLGTLNSGDQATLLVTDNTVYPTIAGAYSDGYDIRVYPGDQPTVSALYPFEFNADYSILPQLVNINNSQYGLRFVTNNAPVVDAGAPLAIASIQQSTTTLVGQASDADGDELTYRWLEGSTVLLAATPVLDDHTTPLNLGLLPSLSRGEHILTLEVTDGTATITANAVLTISNSTPSAVAAGNGSYELQEPVVLGGSVADFDGDVLLVQWKEGEVVLFTDNVATLAGGDPVNLPSHSLSFEQIGSHQIVLTVTDGNGEEVLSTVDLVIKDQTAPSLAPVADKSILWPPNHTLIPITIQAKASDNSGSVTLSAIVYSSEAPEVDGSGNFLPDFTEPQIDQQSGLIQLQLRSERAGTGDGRTYTVVVTATDASANSSTAELKVVAPHNKVVAKK